jgi:hypothetical protein
LFKDSAFIFIADVEPFEPALHGYPLAVTQWFSQEDRSAGIAITSKEFNAAHLTVGASYLFFYALDRKDRTTCIVGGTRGVFGYNVTTQTLTRIGASPKSRVPSVQSLAQFQQTFSALLRAEDGVIHNLPPMCKAAATGLPS